MKKTLAVAFLLLAAAPAFAENNVTITVKEVASDRFELTLISAEVLDVRTAMELLIPVARRSCQNKYPKFGHFQFGPGEGTRQPSGDTHGAAFKLVQQVECAESAPIKKPVDRRSFISGPDEQRSITTHVRALSEAYFADIFSGNYEKAYATLSEQMRSYRTFDKWSAQMDKIKADVGAITEINVHTITTYDNPARAPAPGLYVAADYQNSFENAPYHCGYLTWFREASGEFRITREETGLLTYENLEQLPEEDRMNFLSQIRCTAR